MKTLLHIIGLLIVFPVCGLQAQVVSEDFNDAKLPDGWESTANTGNCTWNIFTADVPQGADFESTALIFDDNLCGRDAPASNVSLVTDTYDVSTVSPLQLSVEIGLNTDGPDERLTIEVYDGNTWQLIDTFYGDYNPFLYKTDVTAYTNANFKVRFTFDDAGDWSFYVGIDNFELLQVETPPLPPQSTCNTAPEITPGITTVQTIRRGNPPPDCNGNGLARGGAWFKYTATRDGVATVSSELPQNDMIDTRLSILQGACGDLNCLAENDDINGSSFFSEVSFLIKQGEQYYIVFDDYVDNSGFDFSLTEKEENCIAGDHVTIDFADRQEFETCQKTLDMDGNGNSWQAGAADFKRDGNIVYFAQNGGNVDYQKEDYLFSPKLILDKNTTYTINFTFNGGNTFSDLANENLQVLVADAPEADANMTEVYKENGIVQQGGDDEEYDMATHVTGIEYRPETSGTYYLTFKTTSPSPSGFLLLFDYSLEVKLGIDDSAIAKVDQYYDKREQQLKLDTREYLENIKGYNMNGQLLLDKKLQGQKQDVDLADFPSGVYVFIVKTNVGMQRFKLLKR